MSDSRTEVPGHDAVGEAKGDFFPASEEEAELQGGEAEGGVFLIAVVPDMAKASLLDITRDKGRARIPTHGNSSDNRVRHADLLVKVSVFRIETLQHTGPEIAQVYSPTAAVIPYVNPCAVSPCVIHNRRFAAVVARDAILDRREGLASFEHDPVSGILGERRTRGVHHRQRNSAAMVDGSRLD